MAIQVITPFLADVHGNIVQNQEVYNMCVEFSELLSEVSKSAEIDEHSLFLHFIDGIYACMDSDEYSTNNVITDLHDSFSNVDNFDELQLTVLGRESYFNQVNQAIRSAAYYI